MAVIKLKPDTLDAETRRFAPTPLPAPLFLNSIPKSGSHLLRNILRMFVPVEQQYRAQFIQWPNLRDHLAAFDPAHNFMSFGHLFFADASAMELSQVRKVLLYRDPYDWVLAQARFFLSDEFHGNVEHIKSGKLSVDDLLSLMIFGIPRKNPSLKDMYELNVAAWLGSADVHPVKFEELAGHAEDPASGAAADYFRRLFDACGIAPPPDDWRERVTTGADRRQSSTARENLTGVSIALPDSLPERHRRLVDFAAPGLRRLLGYD
ncbi:MAG: hypothetical protein M3438_03130 [Pseudomonadota bacterium]|nr:hypothetical protein [Pseudomonadota bacterium]